MLHFGKPVGVVVTVSIYLRLCGFPACCVRMCHGGGFVREGVCRGGHVMPVQGISLHCLHLATADVIVMCGIQLRGAARYGCHAARQRAFAVTRGVLGELPGGESRVTHEPVAVVVVIPNCHWSVWS